MNDTLLEALADLCEEKGLDKNIILDALEAALVAAYRKNFKSAQNVAVQMDRETGEVHVYTQKTVVDEEDYVDPQEEIPLVEAKKHQRNIRNRRYCEHRGNTEELRQSCCNDRKAGCYTEN